MDDQRLNSTEKRVFKTISNEMVRIWEEEEKEGIGITQWTLRLNKALRNLGNEFNYEVRSKSKPHEWLWDLVWLDSEESDAIGGRVIRKMVLAYESELKTQPAHNIIDELYYDFSKLTVALCDLRVFVFFISPEADYEYVFENLKKTLPENKGMKYLVIGLPKRRTESGKPLYRLWVT